MENLYHEFPEKNFSYNLALTFCGYVFPLLTFPYVSRVLGVTNIGICNFVDSIVNYFILFSSLGVGILGTVQIAKNKDDNQKLNEVFSSLVFLNFSFAVVSCIVLVLAVFFIERLLPYKSFLLFGVVKILFTPFVVEWFFKGTSNFKYITIRSFVVKCVYTASVFVFVRTTNDALIFYILSCATIILNAVINWSYTKKFVCFSWKSIKASTYIGSFVSYGMYMILTSLYTSFNVAYLGVVGGDKQVGLYSTATKLFSVILSVFSALTAVMVPKVCEYIAKEDRQKLLDLSCKTFELVFSFSIPLVIICYMNAPLIIQIIAGNGYEGAVMPFRIIASLLLVIGLEQIIIQQFLMSHKKGHCIVVLSLIGAIVGLSMNFILTPTYGSSGSAIAWTSSEVVLLLVGSFYFWKLFKMRVPVKMFGIYTLISLPYIAICYLLNENTISLKVIPLIVLCGAWFVVSNLMVKNKAVVDMASMIKHKFGE